MGDTTRHITELHGMDTRYFRPEDLKIDPRFNMRPWSSETDKDDGDIDGFATQLADQKVGQVEPVIVIPRMGKGSNGREPEEEFVIISGHRRVRAVTIANQKRSESTAGTAEPLRVWCVVDRKPGDARQRAWSANWEHENPSPLDIAKFIHDTMRKEHGDTAKGTGEIARYLGMDKASVRQYEKLLAADVPRELQDRVHSGELSMDSALNDIVKALDAAQVPQQERPKAVDKIVKRARTIQEVEAADKITDKAGSPEVKQAEMKKVREAKRVQAPAVRKAIKEQLPAASMKPKLGDHKEFWEQFDGPEYGHPDSDVRKFVRCYLDEWWEGECKDKKLIALFDKATARSGKGTKKAADEAAAKTLAEESRKKKAKAKTGAKPHKQAKPKTAKPEATKKSKIKAAGKPKAGGKKAKAGPQAKRLKKPTSKSTPKTASKSSAEE